MDERTCRRIALQIATQLPDDAADAAKVLEHAATLSRFATGQSDELKAAHPPTPIRPTLRPVS